jgi:SulP family sulfate permease
MSVTVAGVVGSLAAVGVSRELSSGELLPLVMAAVVIGGLFQILLGVLRLGRYITLVPYSVVSGFMTGIGVIILCLQIGPLMGIASRGGVLKSLQMVLTEFSPQPAALLVGAATLLVVFGCPRRLSQVIPSPLLALVLITPLSLWLFPEQLPRIGTIPEGGLTFTLPNWQEHLPVLLRAGLVLALLGAIDSLLTSLVADNISHTRHRSDRELVGQGIANSVAGLFGGLPGAGATMRTVIDLQSGGRTPLSGMTHSIVLLVLLLGAGPLAEGIPTALLAGILIKVGVDIIDWGFLRRAHRLSFKTALVMWGVLLMTVFWDLIGAVLVGMFVANLLTVDAITQTQLEGMDEDNPIDGGETRGRDLSTEEERLIEACGNQLMLFRLRGPMSFGAAKGISSRMGLVSNYKVLILDISEVPRMGVTAALALERMVQEAEALGRLPFVAGANQRLQERLEKFGVTAVMTTRLDALERAKTHLSQ